MGQTDDGRQERCDARTLRQHGVMVQWYDGAMVSRRQEPMISEGNAAVHPRELRISNAAKTRIRVRNLFSILIFS